MEYFMCRWTERGTRDVLFFCKKVPIFWRGWLSKASFIVW